jgi:hypothetical protein
MRPTALALLLFPINVAAQDTLVVRADNPPVWGASPRLVEELRIGVIDGDPRYTLGRVGDVVEASDGTIWIADDQLLAIRRYSPRGEHLGDVGRRGDGPGEFASIYGMRASGDRVAVFDPNNARVQWFDLSGRYVEGFRAPTDGLVIVNPFAPPLEATSDGDLVLLTSVPDPSAPPTPDGRIPRKLVWLRLSASGEVRDTIPRPAPNADGAGTRVLTSSVMNPLGYRVEGRNAEYALHRALPDGRTVRIERSWDAVPYADGERSQLQARLDAARSDARLAATKPAWSSFGTDAEGRLWIARLIPAREVGETEAQADRRITPPSIPGVALPDRPTRPALTWGQPEVFDVIEPNGRFLGTITLPRSESSDTGFNRRARMAGARGATLWTIEKGEYDEQYVVRYRIVPGN